MTKKDTCGHPTDSGPCKNPPTEGDHCWIDSHGGTVDGHGRPSKLDDVLDNVLDAAENGLSKKGIAETAGVDESTLHRWESNHDDFRKSLRRARARGQRHLIEGGLYGEVDTRMAQFLLERSHGYTKEQEVELSGEVDTGGLSGEDKELLNDLFDRTPQE